MTSDKPDRIVLQGIRKGIDGEYPCDIVGMLTVGHPDMLTYREGHRLKQMTGIRSGEIDAALSSGDTDLIIGLAAIVLARQGLTFDDNLLWDAPIEAGIQLVLGDREPVEDADPLAEGSSSESSTTSGTDGTPATESPTTPPENGSGTSGLVTSVSGPIKLVS